MAVKVLLDSRATSLFIDTAFAKEKGFKVEKLRNPLFIRNVDGTVNIEGTIMHQVKYNIFFKRHVERARIDRCNLGKKKEINVFYIFYPYFYQSIYHFSPELLVTIQSS